MGAVSATARWGALTPEERSSDAERIARDGSGSVQMPCTIELVIVMLLALVPTAVPALVTLPPDTLVQ